jgi:Fur family ferric uptake transcriptional regulator
MKDRTTKIGQAGNGLAFFVSGLLVGSERGARDGPTERSDSCYDVGETAFPTPWIASPPPPWSITMPTTSDFSLGKVDVALTPRERFEEFLQARGKRITRQRRMIVEHVCGRHEHFDAEQLLADLRGTPDGASASRPTVYRTLTELVEAGLLRKMVLGGRAVYEHDYGYPQHDHLHCTGCQTLIEFSSTDLGKILDAVAALHQFRAQGHRLIISGLCMNCRSNRSRSRHQDRV